MQVPRESQAVCLVLSDLFPDSLWVPFGRPSEATPRPPRPAARPAARGQRPQGGRSWVRHSASRGPALAPRPLGGRPRPPIGAAAGPRAQGVHPPPVRRGRPRRRTRLAARPGRHHRRSGQEQPVHRGAARLPAPAGRGRPRPRRADPRAGDEPAGAAARTGISCWSRAAATGPCRPTPAGSSTRPITRAASRSACAGS